MAQTPVAKLMAQDGDDLLGLALLKQGIVDDNVLLPGQTVEVSIAVGTTLAAIDDVQLREGELELLGKVLNTSLDLTRLQRGQLVEQRQNSDGVDSNGEDLDEDTEEPQVVEEGVTSLLDNLEHGADNRSSQNDTQHLALEHVRHPKLESLLVETELLLQHERVVVGDREREDSAENVETEDEQERLRDLALETIGEVPRQHEARDAPELGEDIAVDENEILDLTIETGNEAELSLGATIRLEFHCMSDKLLYTFTSFRFATSYLALIKDLLGNLALEDLGSLCVLKNLILSEREEALKDELAQGEPHEDVLPWEERTVEKTRELLVKDDCQSRLPKEKS